MSYLKNMTNLWSSLHRIQNSKCLVSWRVSHHFSEQNNTHKHFANVCKVSKQLLKRFLHSMGGWETWNGSPCQNFRNTSWASGSATQLPRNLETSGGHSAQGPKHHNWQSCASAQTVFETLTAIPSFTVQTKHNSSSPFGEVVWK